MTQEENSGMEFYFAAKDEVFHWVRTSSLYCAEARREHLVVRTMFRREAIGKSVPVFDLRVRSGAYFRKFHSLCMSAGIPYLFDLDDLIWELPSFSTESAHRLPFATEALMSGATAITASTPELKCHLEHRFPGKPIFLVENCLPAWIAPRHGVLIANTDSFKMGPENLRWFADLLRLLFQHGLSIQLLGENDNLLEHCSDIVVHSQPTMDYRTYLRSLATSDFRLGLIPVEDSNYAACKSAIKAMEFLSQRIPTIASDIAPYRAFARRHRMKFFRVVPNTYDAWRQAVEPLILEISEEEREQGKEINAMLTVTRKTQLEQWLVVADFLRDHRPDPAKMRSLSRKLRPYEFYHARLRPVVRPIVTSLLECFSGRTKDRAGTPPSAEPPRKIAPNDVCTIDNVKG